VEMPAEYWKVVDAESGEGRGKAQGDTMRVRPGEYQIIWRQSQHGSAPVVLGIVEIEAGKLNNIVLGGVNVTAADWVPGAPEQMRLLDAEGNQVGR